MRLLSLCLLASLFAGCYAPSQLLVNQQGQVFRCSAGGTGVAGIITADAMFRSCVTDMQKLGYVKLPDVELGFTSDVATLRLTAITPESGAAIAGLHPGDVITQLDRQPVSTSYDLYQYLQGKQAGESVAVTFRRDAHDQTVEVVLQARTTARPSP